MTIHNPISAAIEPTSKVWERGVVIATIAFLTLIDLFGAQALLPVLVVTYETSPAMMGLAVNACTIGMAVAGLAIAVFGRELNRRRWIATSLAALSIATALLGVVDDIRLFALLRVIQGLFMAAAFTMTLTYLSEHCTVTAATGAMAAYITGNVASNLFGRMLAVGLAGEFGLSASFFIFSALNLLGAVVAFIYFARPSQTALPPVKPITAPGQLLRGLLTPALIASFAIGFLLLFVFIGVFTYVNFVLVEDAFALKSYELGYVYLVFAPALITTPMAGIWVRKLGTRLAFWMATFTACVGLVMVIVRDLETVLLGLALIAVGTFAGQAIVTGYVGRATKTDQAAANGTYLTAYYLGGLTSSIAIGQLFERYGWTTSVAWMLVALLSSAFLVRWLPTEPTMPNHRRGAENATDGKAS